MKEKLRISITSYIHFLVDFTCAYWMFHMIMRQYYDHVSCPVGETLVDSLLGWILLYNFCAFALQLPIGWLVDHYAQKKPWWISSLGCLILAISGALIYGDFWEIIRQAVDTGFSPDRLGRIQFYYSDLSGLCYSVLLGIGNALFHVGAGVEILQLSARGGGKRLRNRRGIIAAIDCAGYRMAPVGIFVSTGVLGLYLGQMLSWHLEEVSLEITDYFQVKTVYSLLVIGLMLAAAGLNFALTLPKTPAVDQADPMSGRASRDDPVWNVGIILLLFLVVVLRSFQGGVVGFSWSFLSFAFVVCVMLAKILGGVLADRIGVLWIALLPLGCSALLFRFAPNYVILGLLALLLFQTTMPITLSLMHRQTPGHPGMAFGLLSFGLFLGSLPDMIVWIRYVQKSQINLLWLKISRNEYIGSIVATSSLVLLLVVLFLWQRYSGRGFAAKE